MSAKTDIVVADRLQARSVVREARPRVALEARRVLPLLAEPPSAQASTGAEIAPRANRFMELSGNVPGAFHLFV